MKPSILLRFAGRSPQGRKERERVMPADDAVDVPDSRLVDDRVEIVVRDGKAVHEGLEERPHPRGVHAHGDVVVVVVEERETRRSLQGLVPDRKSTRLNSSHSGEPRMPSSA